MDKTEHLFLAISLNNDNSYVYKIKNSDICISYGKSFILNTSLLLLMRGENIMISVYIIIKLFTLEF